MEIVKGIFNVGVEDRNIRLFEGILPVPNGMAYNSYLIDDKKIAVLDSVDANFGERWLSNIEEVLKGRLPDYIVVLHMEPDHSANVFKFTERYPSAKVVGNAKTFVMLEEFFGKDYADRRVVVKDGDILDLGEKKLKFVFAPMVHWPEVMTAYEPITKTLFSADAFGRFGTASDGGEWDDEARRYYFAIVGKYGMQVTSLLNKASALEIENICSLHGPVLSGNLSRYLNLYKKWAAYEPEEEGVFIAYSSVYGHTKAAVEELVKLLGERGVKAEACDLVQTERTYCISQAFRYDKIVLASTTYNGDVFPPVREFADCLAERNFRDRKVGLIENGSWAPFAAKAIQVKLEKCKNLEFLQPAVKIRSALNGESRAQLKALAEELAK